MPDKMSISSVSGVTHDNVQILLDKILSEVAPKTEWNNHIGPGVCTIITSSFTLPFLCYTITAPSIDLWCKTTISLLHIFCYKNYISLYIFYCENYISITHILL
jgi:hypothetical protein